MQFTLIHGPNIPGSYAVLFFTALDFNNFNLNVLKYMTWNNIFRDKIVKPEQFKMW